MIAMRLNGWGQPLQLEEVVQPTPASDEVLVRVHAASINPLDVAIHAGYLQFMIQTPLTLGTDFSGVVVETGADVKHVQVGDAVYGIVPFHSGSFAEYTLAKHHEVTHKPTSIDFVQAAGVPLAGLAAFQSLIELGQAQAGQRVVIIGAAGAVGATAVQLAKQLGLHVSAVAFDNKAEFVRELGADVFIDADQERFEDVVGKVDLVLDYVGGDYQRRSLEVIKPGGRYITSLIPQPTEGEAERRDIQVIGLGTQPRTDQLNDLAHQIDNGKLKTFINCTFTLEEVQEAMAYTFQKKAPGKVVLKVM
jgi:NADPH:quinone reductase-like Zn-dependent oxidoreductase